MVVASESLVGMRCRHVVGSGDGFDQINRHESENDRVVFVFFTRAMARRLPPWKDVEFHPISSSHHYARSSYRYAKSSYRYAESQTRRQEPRPKDKSRFPYAPCDVLAYDRLYLFLRLKEKQSCEQKEYFVEERSERVMQSIPNCSSLRNHSVKRRVRGNISWHQGSGNVFWMKTRTTETLSRTQSITAATQWITAATEQSKTSSIAKAMTKGKPIRRAIILISDATM